MSKKSGKKKPQDKKPTPPTKATQGGFGIGFGEVFATGFKGFFSNVPIMMLAGLPVLIVFGVLTRPWFSFNSDLQDRVASGEIDSIGVFQGLQWVGLLMVGALPAGIISAPWFRYALDIVDGKEINWRAPLIDPEKLLHHAFASFWMWAGVAFGLRYLRGIPSILVLILYAFYAYIIADGKEINGLKALGISVRLGQGKRLGLFAFMGIFFVFNLFGATGFAVGLDSGSPTLAGIALGVLGIAATASITLISGARIYRVLEGTLNE